MNKNVKVCILVTFYNQKEYVDEAMQSILCQKTDFEYKVIVGDDGSDDGTLEKLMTWKKKYPDKVDIHISDRQGENIVRGFRASRNRINLLQYVDGDFFIFLDGDDYFTDFSKLQMQVQILESPNNRDCVACAHDIEKVYTDGKRERMIGSWIPEGKIDKKKYWKEYYFHTNTIMVRSSIIKQLPLDILRNNFNDNLITYSIIQFGLIYYIPRCMAAYRQTGDGIWTGEKTIVKCTRNMMMYDIANRINPKMKKETAIRLVESWHMLFDLRKEIESDKLGEFYKEAEDQQLKWTKYWIAYNKLGFTKKTRLIMHYSYILTVNQLRKVEIKAYHLYKKIKKE